MNEEEKRVQSPENVSSPQEASVPSAAVQKPPFSALPRESFCAILMYLAAYFYILLWEDWNWLPAAALTLIALTEWLHWETRRTWESFVWLGCLLCACIGGLRGFEQLRVWNGAQIALFIHIFFVWWVLARSGVLAEGKSGHLLPLDALNGFLVIPFGNFFLRLATLYSGVRSLLPEKEGAKKKPWGWIVTAGLVCLLLFLGAAQLLMRADAGFGALLERFAALFRFEWDGAVLVRLIFSLPVGAWLFGLVSGARRMSAERLARQRGDVYDTLRTLQKVPGGFWTAVTAAFSALYLVFFAVQGRYLFGAFTRTLPEGFIVSAYARQGFFELCKVMAVNFALLWLVTRMATPETAEKRSFRACCVVLLAESMVFAVIALSKLGLYISCFGFTPLRLQSSWLASVLLVGCGLWMYHLLTGRPAFRKWMVFGAVTLSALCLF